MTPSRRVMAVTAAAVAVAAAVLVLGLLLGWPVAWTALAATACLLLVAGALVLHVLDAPVVELAAEPAPDPVTRRLEQLGRTLLRRRGVLVALGAVGLAGAGGTAVAAWPGRPEREGTPWARGTHVVTPDGQRLRPADVPPGGLATVWPEAAPKTELAAVVLVRVTGTRPEPPTVLDWVVDETLLAYSKICTHAGCPVGLLRTGDDALFCPCHQATFDAARGAVPTFGPASAPLPQLPLGVDDEGYLVALGDFPGPVGPRTG